MSTSTHSSYSSSSFTRYRVAAIQYEPILGEKERNVRDLLRLVEEAAQHGARLIVLPEMATTGYCWASRTEIAPHVESIPGPTADRFQQLASTCDCYIALGLPEVDLTTNVYYNSLALIGPEGIIGTYRKIHSYISEPRWARDGDLGWPVWETPLGRLGALICMDAEFFESARILALRGADVLLFPTNWLDEKCPSSWWMARAFENRVYLIAANRYGLERGVQFSGGSCILDPDGSIQAYLDNGEGIVYGEVDLDYCRNKNWGPSPVEPVGNCLTDRRPAEYIELVNNTYLWEPLRYHGQYELSELPPGQLSCVGIVQTNLEDFQRAQGDGDVEGEGDERSRSSFEKLQMLHDVIKTMIDDQAPARPDMLVLPELMVPGPFLSHADGQEGAALVAHFQNGAIEIPGPETDLLIELAIELQISMVLGVAERSQSGRDHIPAFYSTVLLVDPEGIHGIYRKLHLTQTDRLWASPGNVGLPTFDTPTGRIGLATGYDVLFPETMRILAGKGTDLVCAPALLNFPYPIGLGPTEISYSQNVTPPDYDPLHYLIWRVRAAEHNTYLAIANWYASPPLVPTKEGAIRSLHAPEPKGSRDQAALAHGFQESPNLASTDEVRANGYSGIFSPACFTYPWTEVVAEDGELTLTMMTIDTREQRTGRRSSSQRLGYAPGDVAGSLTGELAYDIRDTIPGNVVRSKPYLRKRMPFWYLDLVRS